MRNKKEEDEDPDDPYIRRRLQKAQMMAARGARLAAREARLTGNSANSPPSMASILTSPGVSKSTSSTTTTTTASSKSRRQSAPARVANMPKRIGQMKESRQRPELNNGRSTHKKTSVQIPNKSSQINEQSKTNNVSQIKKKVVDIDIGANHMIGQKSNSNSLKLKEIVKISSFPPPRPPEAIRRYSNSNAKKKVTRSKMNESSGEELISSSGIEIINNHDVYPIGDASSVDGDEGSLELDDNDITCEIVKKMKKTTIKTPTESVVSSTVAGSSTSAVAESTASDVARVADVEDEKEDEKSEGNSVEFPFDSTDDFNSGLEALCRDLALDLHPKEATSEPRSPKEPTSHPRSPNETSSAATMNLSSFNEIDISLIPPEAQSQQTNSSCQGGEKADLIPHLEKYSIEMHNLGKVLVGLEEAQVGGEETEKTPRRNSPLSAFPLQDAEMSNLLQFGLNPSESLLAHGEMNVSSCGGSDDRSLEESESDGIPPDLDFSLHNSALDESGEAFENSLKFIQSMEKTILGQVEEKERELRKSASSMATTTIPSITSTTILPMTPPSTTRSKTDVGIKNLIPEGIQVEIVPPPEKKLEDAIVTRAKKVPGNSRKSKSKSRNKAEVEIIKLAPPVIETKTEEPVEPEEAEMKEAQKVPEQPRAPRRSKDEATAIQRTRDSLIARRRLRSRGSSVRDLNPRRPQRLARKRKEEGEERQVGKRRREPPSFLRDYQLTKDLRGFEGSKPGTSREKKGFPILTAGEALRSVLSIPEPLLPSSHLAYFHRFKRSVNLLSDTEEASLREIIRAKQGKKTQKVVLNRIRERRLLEPGCENKIDCKGDEVNDEEEKNSEERKEPPKSAPNPVNRRVFNLRSSMSFASRNVEEPLPAKAEILDENRVLIGTIIVRVNTKGHVKETDVILPLDEDFIPVKERKLVILLPDEDPKRETGVVECLMKEGTCRLGCVCGSISATQRPRDHCGRPKCFFKCNCSFPFDVKRGMIYDHDTGDIRTRLRTRNLKFKNKKENSPPRKIRKIVRDRSIQRSLERLPPKLEPEIHMPQMSLISIEPGPEEIDSGVDFLSRYSPTMFTYIASDFDETDSEDERVSKTLTPSNVLNRVNRGVQKFPIVKNKPGSYSRPRLPDNRLKPPSPLPEEFREEEEAENRKDSKRPRLRRPKRESQEVPDDDDEEYKPTQSFRPLFRNSTGRRKRRIHLKRLHQQQRHKHKTIRQATLNKTRENSELPPEPIKLRFKKVKVKEDDSSAQASQNNQEVNVLRTDEVMQESPTRSKRALRSPSVTSAHRGNQGQNQGQGRKKSVRFSERISVKTIKAESPPSPKVLKVMSLGKKSSLKKPREQYSPSISDKTKKRLVAQEIAAIGEKMSKECQAELELIKEAEKVQKMEEENRRKIMFQYLEREPSPPPEEVNFNGKTYGRRSFLRKTEMPETVQILPETAKWKVEENDQVYIEGNFSFDGLSEDYDIVEVSEYDDEIMEIPVSSNSSLQESQNGQEELFFPEDYDPFESFECPAVAGPSRAVTMTTTSVGTPRTASHEVAGGELGADERVQNCILSTNEDVIELSGDEVTGEGANKDSLEIHSIDEADFFDEDEDGEYEVIKVVVGDDFDIEDESQVMAAVERTDALYQQVYQDNAGELKIGDEDVYTYQAPNMTVTLMPNKK